MPRLSDTAVPAYCKHRGSGQAVVTLDGRDFYLGKYNSAESKAEYNRHIREWPTAGRKIPVNPLAVTVGEIALAYIEHAKTYYRRADGTPTNEAGRVVRELTPMTKLYHKLAASDFGPLRLKAVRDSMVAAKWVRTSVNHAVGTIKRCFRWAAENEMIPAEVFHGLSTVTGLKAGRCDAAESEPVKPVPMEYVDAVIRQVSRQIGAMIQLQLLTGMRSGELVMMRGADIDTTGKLWIYRPAQHKTKHHGHIREVYLGPKARAIVEQFLKLDPQAYLFNPAEAHGEQLDQWHAERKTPMSCGNKPGKRMRKYQPHYTNESYRRAVARGCERADAWAKGGLVVGNDEVVVPHWHPHQLRHNFATEMRKDYGAEAALTMLGDKSTRMIDIYAEKNRSAAMKIMAEVG